MAVWHTFSGPDQSGSAGVNILNTDPGPIRITIGNAAGAQGTVQFDSVPEPASLALMGPGAMRRRKTA